MATARIDSKRAKSPSGSERRIAERNKSYAEAWADPGGMNPAIICKIIDISHTGAKLAFNPNVKVPDRFILHTGFTKRPAFVVWRREAQIGVEFELRRKSDLYDSAYDGPPPGVAERRQPFVEAAKSKKPKKSLN